MDTGNCNTSSLTPDGRGCFVYVLYDAQVSVEQI